MARDKAEMTLRDRPEFKDKQNPLTAGAEMSVREAARRMSAERFGSIIVVDADNRVEGVVTERDLMTKVIGEERDPDSTTLADIMTPDPRVAQETDNLLDWLRIMSNERFRRLPVVDSEGRIKAVFTQGDFVSYTWPDLLYQAGNLARASIGRHWAAALIGGGIMVYTILVILVLGLA